MTGLKRKIFNSEGGVRKAGRVDTKFVCPCVCPAESIGGEQKVVLTVQEIEAMECSGAEGRDDSLDIEMPSQSLKASMPSQ